MPHYIVYKTTNNTNSKIYIGTHKQADGFDPYEFDGYLGSGIAVNHAIRRDGRNNFSRETLFVFDNRKDCLHKESELVTYEFTRSQENYNMMPGGDGGWDFVNDNGLTYVRTVETELKRRTTLIERYGIENAAQHDNAVRVLIARNKQPKSIETRRKQSASLKASGKVAGVNNAMYGKSGELAPCYGRTGEKHPMFGHNHTEEAKAKIRASCSKSPKPKVSCPHCDVIGGKPVMTRFHFDNCKFRVVQ
jgi:hypothetical protein